MRESFFTSVILTPRSKLLKPSLLIMTLLSTIITAGCSDKVTSPAMEKIYGVQGHIIDTSGTPIIGAKIYCLFDYGYIPDTAGIILPGANPLADDIFTNKLEQNFPNPLSYDTYLRFSVDQKSAVELKLVSRVNDSTIYLFRDTLFYGLYQKYLTPGAGLGLKNGPYRYILKISPLTGESIVFEKEMFIINDKNEPNSISIDDGYYIFNYDEAFINDTVKDCSIYYPDDIFDHILSENVVLLVEKEGYIPRYVYVKLFSGLFFNQDIVLYNEEVQ